MSKSAFWTFKWYFELEKPKVWFKAWGCGEVGPGRSQLIARKSARQKLPHCTLALCCAVLVVLWTLLATMFSQTFSKLCLYTHIYHNALQCSYARPFLRNGLLLDLAHSKAIYQKPSRPLPRSNIVWNYLCYTCDCKYWASNILHSLRMCGSWRFFGHTSDIFATTHPHTKIMNIGLSFEKIHRKGA